VTQGIERREFALLPFMDGVEGRADFDARKPPLASDS
jgi:hypothetical protein